jgi:hypothetical protein
MRGQVHVCRLALVVLLVGVGSLGLDAHQDPLSPSTCMSVRQPCLCLRRQGTL